MADQGCICLDSKAFDNAIAKKDELVNTYNQLNDDYDRIVTNLLNNWKGRGADAFAEDARTVKTNIVGIFDILKTMCDTLIDCRAVFAECDTALGESNRESK